MPASAAKRGDKAEAATFGENGLATTDTDMQGQITEVLHELQ